MEHLLKILTNLELVAAVVITFGLAVFVHEFGHMFFALLRGVGVESFAIGMGPKIVSWKWRGIDFSLRWFPVGGFVKLGGRTPPATAETLPGQAVDVSTVGPTQELTGTAARAGDQLEAEDKSNEKSLAESSYDDLYALQDKGLITKVLVFGGGVFMNFVTAIITCGMILLIGQNIDQFRFQIEKIEPNSMMAKAGLMANDMIVAINGQPVKYDSDFIEKLGNLIEKNEKPFWTRTIDSLKKSNTPPAEPTIRFSLTVQRNGTKKILDVPPMTNAQVREWLKDIKIIIPPLIGDVGPGTPADNAGLKAGDRVQTMAGHKIETFDQMVQIIHASLNKPVPLTVLRGGKPVSLTVTPSPSIDDPQQGQIGIIPGSDIQEKVRETNLLKVIKEAPLMVIDRAVRIIQLNIKFFKKASFRQVRENVGGPIAIAAITAKAAQKGFVDSAEWFVTLNLLLMIFNLLPLPVLDGGFILLAFIEAVIRRPVPPKVLGPVYTFFVIGLIVLILLISVQDVARWIPKMIH